MQLGNNLGESEVTVFWQAVSRLLGWTYFACWSLSFYPQPLLNYKRRSTDGLAVDFSLLNLLGFLSYTTSCAAFLYSPTIRAQYANRHPASPEPTVRFNDLAFAVHALFMCFVTYSQFFSKLWNFEVRMLQRSSRIVLGILWGCIIGVAVVIGVVRFYGDSEGYDPTSWAWIDTIYATSYVKLIVTVVKYIPQARMNYIAKSTAGWSIVQILLDFAGGVMSILQLVIDSSLQGDWSGLTANPVKFGLGNVSVFFDVIFMVQHYILYRPFQKLREERIDEDVEQSLI